ncbi:hypothetical protein FRC03_007286 [Tulasnella sp. 419]|nr:hypothetical protein FRC03_007286 [Tulasnella sp. 419]
MLLPLLVSKRWINSTVMRFLCYRYLDLAYRLHRSTRALKCLRAYLDYRYSTDNPASTANFAMTELIGRCEDDFLIAIKEGFEVTSHHRNALNKTAVGTEELSDERQCKRPARLIGRNSDFAVMHLSQRSDFY